MNDSAPLLEVRDVAKRFGAVIALKSATLNLVRGEIHALMEPAARARALGRSSPGFIRRTPEP